MKYNKNNMLLIAGLAFIFGGILLLVHFSKAVLVGASVIRFLLPVSAGSVLLYFSLTGTKRFFFTFSGLFLCGTALLLLITDTHLIRYNMMQIWPVTVIMSGVLLFPSGYIRFRRLPAAYTGPGIMLTVLGLIFLCFSLNIISLSFTEFASRYWPIVFILFGFGLIALFAYTQTQKKAAVFEDSDEDEDLQ